jgi:hypothetical protein
MRIEVVYATPARQECVRLEMPDGASALAAIRASGLLARHPESDLARGKVGVFGKVVAPDTPLTDGDRVEIYRPLAVDPRAARRARAGRRPR